MATLHCILAVVLLCQASIDQAPAKRVRVVPHLRGVPLASRLLPNDEIVVVKPENEGVVFVGEPTAAELIRYEVGSSDLALVVDVDHVTGVLSEDQSSVRTRIEGVAGAVFMQRKGRVAPGLHVEVLDQSSGEMQIGGVTVRFGHAPKVEAGRRYLMFLGVNPDTGQMYPSATPRLVVNDKLINPWKLEPGNTTHDPLHGMKLDEVAREIRALSK